MTTTATTTRLGALSRLGTSVWLDSMRRAMLDTGELERLIREDSVVGVTTNPSILEKAILGSSDYDERLAELTREGAGVEAIYEALVTEDVGRAADILRPMYEESGRRDGYVSLEVSPDLARNPEGTLKSAGELWARLDRPNVMIKIPGTEEGLDAVTGAIAAGINVNVTLLFSVDTYTRVAEAYIAGLEERAGRGEPLDHVASVASFFVSRVDTAVDRMLAEAGSKELMGKAAVANARVAYERSREIFGSDRFAALSGQGARPQRLLWASTSTKNPNYPDVKYVEELAGPETVNTMPMATLLAFQEHGEAGDNLSGKAEEAARSLVAIEKAGISIDEVTATLLEQGIESFADSMRKLIEGIDRRRAAVVAGEPAGVKARLTGGQAEAVGKRVSWARSNDVARRVWRKDHTLWGPEPQEIVDRLGWLQISEKMLEDLGEIAAFVDEVRAAGITDCVLLGMGGSSLAPEVIRRTFGLRDGYLKLHVLDSTHPDAVAALAGELPLESTLFLVSSKSGGTLETLSFYRYFRERMSDPAHFVAITDPGTSLAELGEREGFRRVFLNAADIGGRYSALSYFGVVPAALAGVDIEALLARAEQAVHCAMPEVPCEEGTALWLGLALGELAASGRDKLTFVVSEPLGSFGLWAEQLVAESSGKKGKGIVPVAGEPLGEPAVYGDDRVFAYIRDDGDPDEATDNRLEALAAAGHPVITLGFREPCDLGAQFFLWEFAVAVACAVLEINAFDQPNVQEAKDLTAETMETYLSEGRFPDEPPGVTDGAITVRGSEAGSVREAIAALLREARVGSYVALMAYVPPGEAAKLALEKLRRSVRDALKLATTSGYGPRFLHSTGQLHKGGPPSGVFVQITGDGRGGVDIPDAGYDFGALIKAQAAGDLKALKSRGRPVLAIHVAGDAAGGLEQLADLFAGAADQASRG